MKNDCIIKSLITTCIILACLLIILIVKPIKTTEMVNNSKTESSINFEKKRIENLVLKTIFGGARGNPVDLRSFPKNNT